MAFPALEALREGYDVYPVVDAILAAPTRKQTATASNESCRPVLGRFARSRYAVVLQRTGRARRRWLM